MNASKKLLIAVSYVTIFMLGVYLSMYQITLLNISQHFSTDSVMRGTLVAVQYIGICVPPLFIAGLAGKVGKKKVLVTSLIMLVIGLFSVYFTNNLLSFVISLLIIGGGFSITEATFSAALSDEFPKNSQKHISFSQALFSTGAVLGPLVSEALLKTGISWKNLFFYCAVVFTLLLTVFIFVKLDKNTEENAKTNTKRIFELIRGKAFLLIAFSIFIYVGIEELIGFFADSYFNISVGAPGLSAVALSLYWAAMIPSRFLVGVIIISPRKIISICSIGIFISLAAAMLVPINVIKVILFTVSGMFCGPVWGIIMSSAAQEKSWNSAASLNILMSMGGLGGAVLPFLAGVLVSYSGEYAAYFLAAVASILMLSLFTKSQKSKHGLLSQ